MFDLAGLNRAKTVVYRAMPPTPQYHWPGLSERAGCEVWVMRENHAPTGAFKVRGGLVLFDELHRTAQLPRKVITATRQPRTEQHVNEHGPWGNDLVEADHRGPSHVRSIRDAGYHTATFGKMHLARDKMTIGARTRVPVELYDMDSDPLELENRAEEPGLRGLKRRCAAGGKSACVRGVSGPTDRGPAAPSSRGRQH